LDGKISKECKDTGLKSTIDDQSSILPLGAISNIQGD